VLSGYNQGELSSWSPCSIYVFSSNFFNHVVILHSFALCYHLAHKMGHYHELWQDELHKVHQQKLALELLALEAKALADKLKRSADQYRRVVLERDNLVAVVRSKDQLL
ncbi:hypothetical protein U1Q18_037651, partial [Sarracenia purpurea var. burkii]